MVHFRLDARPAVTDDLRELAEDIGEEHGLASGQATSRMVGRFGARSRVREGDTVQVAVDTRALHFFDPQTGLGI